MDAASIRSGRAAGSVSVIAFAALTVAVIVAHFIFLEKIPRGLYCDESSIGQNAALILETGRDEHGVRMPVFFKGFGEYHTPILIYATALWFKIAGVSVYGVRAVNALFYMLLWAACVLFARRAIGGAPVVLYAAATAGFLPWYFTFSRIAFEMMTQVAFTACAVYLLHRAFEGAGSRAGRMASAAGAGAFTALSVYSYASGRVLGILFIALAVLVYAGRGRLSRLGVFLSAAAAGLLPYLYFAATNWEALTIRFRHVSYWSANIPLIEKISLFAMNYAGYFGPNFLLFKGDNLDGHTFLRHSTGHGGVLYYSTFVLFWIGFVAVWTGRVAWPARFRLFVTASLFLSPVAAAFTNWNHVHGQRGALLSFYMLIFSCAGFAALVRSQKRRYLTLVLVALFAVESGSYVYDYFTDYAPRKSADAFESWDFESALRVAARSNPREIIVSKFANQPYIHAAFFARFIPELEGIPVRVDEPVPARGACLVYFAWNEPPVSLEGLAYDESGPSGGVVKVRCYR